MQLTLLEVQLGIKGTGYRRELGFRGKELYPRAFTGLFWGLCPLTVSMMHQQAATSHYNSAQGGSQHYQGQAPIAMMGQSGQGGSMMGQRPMAPYRPSQQGEACLLRCSVRGQYSLSR